MKYTEFYKVYGANKRQDQIVKLSDKNYLLIFGFGKDSETEENGYHWRKNYDHEPSETELRKDISELVNSIVDENILNGMRWKGQSVYLSTENQMNFKAAYDLAVQSQGEILPIRFKLGEDTDGEAIYHTFEAMDDFTDFYTSCVMYVQKCINEGWEEKDSFQLVTTIME